MQLLRQFKYIYLINLVILIIFFCYRNALPSSSSVLNHSLHNEPLQTPTNTPPFYVTTPEMRFYIEPVFNYKIYGLVVSKYNARKHFMARSDKNLNVTDICVIWGNTAFNQSYKDWTFWSGSWTCFGQAKTHKAYNDWRNNNPNGFNWEQLSNNHLLTNDSMLKKQLTEVNIGDQIYIEGYLANYGTSSKNIHRKTSTTRTDTGNGACETIYVTKFELIKANTYRKIYTFSLYLLIIMTIGFIVVFYYLFHYKKQDY